METRYQNREIDTMINGVHERFDKQDIVLIDILTNAKYTNGKVRKIIIVLVLLGGILVGLMGKEVIVPVLLHII